MKLACFGEVLWDIFDDKKTIGGAPFNVCAVSKLLGIDSAMITAVGRDTEGEEILEEMAKRGICFVGQINSNTTGESLVVLHKKEPSFEIPDNASFDYIGFDSTIEKTCSEADIFCFGTVGQRNKDSRKTLRKCINSTAGVKIYDFNYREGIEDWRNIFWESAQHCDILKLNENELEILKKLHPNVKHEDILRNLMEEHDLKYIVLTRGKNGASLISKEGTVTAKGHKVNVIDTTGCGDAFVAGLIYGLSKNLNDQAMLDFAVKLSAHFATFKGAVPDELDYEKI